MKHRISPRYSSPSEPVASTGKGRESMRSPLQLTSPPPRTRRPQPPSFEKSKDAGISLSTIFISNERPRAKSTPRARPSPENLIALARLRGVEKSMMSSTPKTVASAATSSTPVSDDSRRRRFDKFRSRSRLSESPPAEEPIPSGSFFPETPRQSMSFTGKSDPRSNFLPVTPAHRGSGARGLDPPEGSSMRPIPLGDVLKPEGSSMSSGSIPSPPLQTTSRFASQAPSFETTLQLNQRMDARDLGSIAVASMTSSARDRIEEARDELDVRPPFSDIRMEPESSDRVEIMRELEYAQHHGSIGIPSLHSRISRDFHADRNFETQIIKEEISESSSGLSGVDPPVQKGHSKPSRSLRSLTPPRRSAEMDRVGSFKEKSSPSTATALPELDLRTVRLLYSKEFSDMIASQKGGLYQEDQDENETPFPLGRNGVSFVVRKRPILKEEILAGDFDVVATYSQESVKVYQTQVKSDFITKHVKPVTFRCNGAFSDGFSSGSEDFYRRAARPMVLSAMNGGCSTMVMFGQPGSGKTHTMSDIEGHAAFDIFGASLERNIAVSVTYIELCGSQCRDLLGAPGAFVRVVEKEGGHFRFKGALSKSAASADNLIAIITGAKQRRKATGTIRHQAAVGLSSHIFCQINIRNERQRGSLNLLESTGTQNGNSGLESAEVTSFQGLTDCFRARVSRTSSIAPYNSSNITKILRECFQRQDSRFCIVANVSPKATDTECTIEMLTTLSDVMAGFREGAQKSSSQESDDSQAEELILPRRWSHTELVSFLVRKRLLGSPVPTDINGRFAMRMSKIQLKNTFYDVLDQTKAEKLFIALRAENDRVARVRVKRRLAREK
jgi:kinesin family protein 2/24